MRLFIRFKRLAELRTNVDFVFIYLKKFCIKNENF